MVVIADESMFIMPVSTDNIINGGKIQGIRELTELLEADASSTTTIKIPVSYHDLISIGMKQYIFASRGQVDMQNASKTEYDTAVQSMIEELSDRYISAVRTNLPTLTYLQ